LVGGFGNRCPVLAYRGVARNPGSGDQSAGVARDHDELGALVAGEVGDGCGGRDEVAF